MSRIFFAIVTAFAILSLSACGTIGKGKGKAPPPVVETAPEPAPVYK
jgi:hypothetical protein